MTVQPYGALTVVRHDDGRVDVTDMDPVIGITVQLLAEAVVGLSVDPDGNLVIAGQCAYRPVGFASSNGGRADIVVCQRVW